MSCADGYAEDEVVYIWSGDSDAVKKYKDITMAQFNLTNIEHGQRRTGNNHGRGLHYYDPGAMPSLHVGTFAKHFARSDVFVQNNTFANVLYSACIAIALAYTRPIHNLDIGPIHNCLPVWICARGPRFFHCVKSRIKRLSLKVCVNVKSTELN